jgi:hypothetical protein
MEAEEEWSEGIANGSKRRNVSRAEDDALKLFEQYRFLNEEELREVRGELKTRGGQK